MNFEQNNNNEKPKSKREMIMQKQTELANKIAELDNFAENIKDEDKKAAYTVVLNEVKKLNEEIVTMISELDEEDAAKDVN